MAVTIKHPDGVVTVESVEAGRNRICVTMASKKVFAPVTAIETAYPMQLITRILDAKGPAYLCDEIAREEDPRYVRHSLEHEVLGYIGEDESGDKRVLDFGCGAGASTMALGRLFPIAQIIGVDFNRELLEVARLRADHYGFATVQFSLSPGSAEIPSEIGQFDYIILSAVYEHLLPGERRSLVRALWDHLAPGGIVFISQTPDRNFPFESHTTELPLINYLPDRMALRFARVCSRRVGSSETWECLLRRGVRGGTAGEVMGILADAQGKAVILNPARWGLRDRIDLWHRMSAAARWPAAKRLAMLLFRALKSATGIVLTPSLSLAIKKVD